MERSADESIIEHLADAMQVIGVGFLEHGTWYIKIARVRWDWLRS